MSEAPVMKEVQPEALSKTKLKLWLSLLKTTRLIEAEIKERLRQEFQTTLPRFDVLAALYRTPKGLKMGDLSVALKVSNGNVTGIVERLVKDGLVVRVPVEGDRRALLVCLTQKGREEFSEQASVHEAWIDGLFGDFDRQKIEGVHQDLSLIYESLEGNRGNQT